MSPAFIHYRLDELDLRESYRLLTTIVVPRPIAWVSTLSTSGVPNLAPFSYFSALAADPMLIGVSIGERSTGDPKDSLKNIRDTGVFCVNVVTTAQLDVMNATAASLPPEKSEFDDAQVDLAWTEVTRVPFVEACPVVLECTLNREIDLAPARSALVIGEVHTVRVRDDVLSDDPFSVDVTRLEPVGRLGGKQYAMPGPIRELPRP